MRCHTTGRKLAVIYYLNEHWHPGHGGELRIWPRDAAPASLKHDISDATDTGSTDAEPPPVIVEPLADRLLLFISSLEHEVLPAWRPRYALTTWMYNRRDTALEAWAEEMREKKASGKLNTKAILAALDADSSSESDDNSDAKGGGDKVGKDEDGGRGEQGVRRESAMSVMLALLKRKQAKERAAMQRLDDASLRASFERWGMAHSMRRGRGRCATPFGCPVLTAAVRVGTRRVRSSAERSAERKSAAPRVGDVARSRAMRAGFTEIQI